MSEHGLAFGMPIHVNAMMPEVGAREALPDAEDRLRAMTLHHVDLSLLDLTSSEPVVFMIGGKILTHPNNLERLRAAGSDTAPTDGEPTPDRLRT